MEVWQADADELRPDLTDAAGRGVRVTAVVYGEADYPFAEVRLHPSTDEVTAGLGGPCPTPTAEDHTDSHAEGAPMTTDHVLRADHGTAPIRHQGRPLPQRRRHERRKALPLRTPLLPRPRTGVPAQAPAPARTKPAPMTQPRPRCGRKRLRTPLKAQYCRHYSATAGRKVDSARDRSGQRCPRCTQRSCACQHPRWAQAPQHSP